MSGEIFESLLLPNLPSVRKLVQRRVKTHDQAEDIVQQTLLRAFVFRHQLRCPAKFKSWVWSIAMNEVRGFHRASVPSVSLDDSPADLMAAPAPSPLAMCEQSEEARRLRAGIESLPRRDRTAIQLVDLHGLSIAEAANEMALSIPALKSMHFRARKRLGNALRRTNSL